MLYAIAMEQIIIIGGDFYRAMVVTAAGEKLVIGRRPVMNWTQLQFFLCFAVNSEMSLMS